MLNENDTFCFNEREQTFPFEKLERWASLFNVPLVDCCFNVSVVPSFVLLVDKVALKILDKTRLDSQAHRLLYKEISNMECLHHPNVVRLFEVVETPSRLYLVLEYAGGGDLHSRIATDGKLSDNASKIIFAQILSAIKYMVSLFILVGHGFSDLKYLTG